MKKQFIYFVSTLLLVFSCSSNNLENNSGNATNPSEDNNNNNNGDGDNNPSWLIPLSEVKDGGPGKDGIPSIDDPNFINVPSVNFLNDDDLVIGTINNGVAKAYPHIILDWHEIVNDEVMTINYCPLTGTAFGWESKSNDESTTFGVSGLLYNANLILYDRNTGSNWSQIRLECVNGELIGDKPIIHNVVETNWKTWKALYPNSKVLDVNTGFSRNYGVYPYGSYKANHSYFIFQPSILNDILPNKERVYAIINNNKSKVYQLSKFGNGNIIRDIFEGSQYLIVGSRDLTNAFILEGDQTGLIFNIELSGDGESFLNDNEGNSWSVFGKATSGPRTGEQLKPAKAVISYWFAIAAFYPNPELYVN